MEYNIIFATKNKGKLKEINEILDDKELKIISMEEIGISIDVEENGKTFEENAIKKAKEIMLISNNIVMADDSGLEIDYLNKAPGIYSARYLGEDTPYIEKNKKLLEKLKDISYEHRTARFVSAIATAFPNGDILVTRGTIEGYITNEIRGKNGFGYDPIFYVPQYKCTTAEMPLELKNKISHRGKALRNMKEKLLMYFKSNS